MSQRPLGKTIILICLVAALSVIGYSMLNAPDRRSTGDKIGDAINELPNGVDKAARQMQERTPADKLSDAAKDAADDLKKATNQQ